MMHENDLYLIHFKFIRYNGTLHFPFHSLQTEAWDKEVPIRFRVALRILCFRGSMTLETLLFLN